VGTPAELGGQGHAFSIYEPQNLADPTNGDVQVVIVDTGLQPIETLDPVRAFRSVPFVPAHQPSLPTIVPMVVDPTAVAADSGPWTRDEAVPAPPAPVRRTVIANAPSAPKPRRKATVNFTSFGPASKEEQEWVVGGDSGMRLVTTDEFSGRPRLVAVYIAFMVEAYVMDDARPDEVSVFGKVRWHGMPADREEEWANKLIRWHGGQRQRELARALEIFHGFADPRIGMVERFLGGPATTGAAAATHGYQCFPGDGSPSVKFMVDMSRTLDGARAAVAFYQEAQDLFALPLRRLWWKRFNPAREARYVLGEQFEIEGLPSPQVRDGLSAFQRDCLGKDVAEAAGGPVASFGKVAWRGDQMVEDALLALSLEPVGATTYTMCEGEGEGE
jgi:hypothetical protein